MCMEPAVSVYSWSPRNVAYGDSYGGESVLWSVVLLSQGDITKAGAI